MRSSVRRPSQICVLPGLTPSLPSASPASQLQELNCWAGQSVSQSVSHDIALMTIFRPKGVILSHQNIVSATSAAILQLGKYAPTTTDILYSYLPLSHTLERCCELSVFMAGGAVGFHSGSLKFADSDMKSLKPTILPAVPKFLNRIYDSCVTTANKERPSFVRAQI